MAEEVKEEKGIKAKTWSLIGKIAGAVIIIGGAVLKWTGILPDASIKEVCIVGFSIMGVFGTIDINLALDKFTK